MREPLRYVPGQTSAVNASWSRLYDRMSDLIVSKARKAGLDRDAARDVLQETMVTVMRAQRGEVAGHNPAAGQFKNWLLGVVRNRIRSELRKAKKEPPRSPLPDSDSARQHELLPEIAVAPCDFVEIEDQEWRKAFVAAALERLRQRVKPKTFEIFKATLQEAATSAALAARYNTTPNNIYQITHQCRALLQAEAKALYEAWIELGR